MLKSIKKSLKYFAILVGILIMLPTLLYLGLQIPEVQTLIVNKITGHFSAKLKSTISVGRLELKFFNKLAIDNLLIKDENKDTLLYTHQLIVGVRGFNLKSKSFLLGRVSIKDPVIAFKTDSTGQMNISWYLSLLRNSADTTKKVTGEINIHEIDISNAKFTLLNQYADTGKTKIHFNNIKVTGLNGIVEDLVVKDDTTSFSIYNLALTEQSGFAIKKLNGNVSLAKQNILLNSIVFTTDSSSLNITKLALTADSAASYKKFTEEVRLDIRLEKSRISSSDIGYFVPSLNGLNESVWVSGKFMGTISELRGRDLKLTYGNYTSLDCDFDFSGLPKIENAYLYIGVNSLNTNARDFEHVNFPGKGKLVIPEVLYNLGDISFDGSFNGFTTDFVTYGKFRTGEGSVRTDISVRPEQSNRYRVKGLINGSEIDLGRLTGNPRTFGKLSMQANVDGYAFSLKKFAANLTGKVDSIEVNKYKYRNIDLNGFFTDKTWDGSINVKDNNIKLSLLGMFDFTNKLPEFDFTLNLAGANLHELNLDKIDSTSYLTMLLTANFKGNSIDNLDGEIKLLNSTLKKHNKTLELYDFSLKTFTENNLPVLSLRTDFVDADIRGYYNFAGIRDLIKSSLSALMPSEFPVQAKHPDNKRNNFSFEVDFKKTDKINDFFKTGIRLADKSYIKGYIRRDSTISMTGKSTSLGYKNLVFNDFNLNADLTASKLGVKINSSDLALSSNTDLKGFSIRLNTLPDNFTFKVNWDNNEQELNKGSIVAHGQVEKNISGKGHAILTVNVDSSDVYSRDVLWKIKRSSIVIDSNAIKVDKFYAGSGDHYYLANGTVSVNPVDTLHLQFKGIDISPLNYIVNRNNDPNRIPMDFKGMLSGKILLSNVYKKLLLESNIIVTNFSLLGSEYGNISIISALDNARKVVKIDAGNNLNGVHMFDISGFYDPNAKRINLTAKAAKMPIEILNPLLKTFASNITGFASGKVTLSGPTDNLVLNGALKAENASMKIDYLQTAYKINDTVRFDKEGIKFNNLKLTDDYGKTAFLTGTVYNKNFKEFSVDITINISSSDFLVLNTQQKDNPMFYGKVFGSGVAKIKSTQNSLSFDISARTGKNSKFYIPLNNGSSVSDYSFIKFIQPTSLKIQEAQDSIEAVNDQNPNPVTAKQLGIDLNIDLTVTPDATVQLIFDPKVGDKMTGTGSARLNITLNRKGDFGISGDYTVEKGDYLFTLKNIINKKFDVESGGQIIFNGNLYNTDIDLKATYQRFNTSLQPILGLSERISVEPRLILTGKLFNPNVGFEIYLPSADEGTRALVNNAMSTEEELNRQFLCLLVTKNFYATQGNLAGQNTGQTQGNIPTSGAPSGTSAMAVTTTEMLSNQLSNWISQINSDFNLGFVYKPGSGSKDINPQELQVALSTQLLNDKVSINGNFDYRGVTSAYTDQLTGDFDAELKLTEKLRLKVFNRFNDISTGKGPYTQGVGIIFKENFKKFSDLFRRRPKQDIKKEDEPALKNQ